MESSIPLWVNILVLVVSSLGGLSAVGTLLQSRRQAQQIEAETKVELDSLNDKVLSRTKELLNRQSSLLDAKQSELEEARKEISELRGCKDELTKAFKRIRSLESKVSSLLKNQKG